MAENLKVLLIDGHSLAYRAFFALPSTLTTSTGKPTGAVYGFTSMLLKVLAEENPDVCIVAFDGPRAELHRTKIYPEYKGQRKPMPAELKEQLGMIENLLKKMKIMKVQVQGFEADDILGTIAKKLAKKGDNVFILTGDRDTLQLVDDRTKVILTSRGITDVEFYDREKVKEKYGVPPEKIPEVKALEGDASDNIPGVSQIGAKGARELISKYGSLDELYEHLDEVKGRKREPLEKEKDTAFISRELARINTEVPIEIDLEDAQVGRWDVKEVIDYLSVLEFKTLINRFLEIAGEKNESDVHQSGIRIRLLGKSANEIESFKKNLLECKAVGLAAEITGSGFCDISCINLALATDSMALIIHLENGDAENGIIREFLSSVFSSDIEKRACEGRKIILGLWKSGFEFSGPIFDTSVASYLLNPSLPSYHLETIWERNSGEKVMIEGETTTLERNPSLLDYGKEQRNRLAIEAAQAFRLGPVLWKKLEESGMKKLAREIEMPLVLTLAGMEKSGVAVDRGVLDELSKDAQATLSALEEEIFELAGHPFNISSTKQLGKVLFEEMGITPLKKTKTGYSTDSSVLEILKSDYEIAGKLLEYRENSKLKSTYLDALPALVCSETGRIHCSFNQTATATGRISSSNPNLQNIPVRTELGKKIRHAFVPGEKGWKLLVADYSQIELRVLAHMSEDPLLLEAFERDADIHAETASSLFGIPPEEVTPEARRMAKVVNFGIVYGMGYYGLSSRLGISSEEATKYIDTYFRKYEKVKEYRESCVFEARRLGYAETLLGRRRYIPELSSESRHERELGERLAINTPLQGTAADIIKKAMIDIDTALKQRGMGARMILQVHDELILESPPGENEELEELVRECMEKAVELKVKLKVDIGIYETWGEVK